MTLIELMIVVAIVAILGTIAVTSYRGYVLRSNRTEASAALLRIQVAQEKYYLNKYEYAADLDTLGLGNLASTERGLYNIRLQRRADNPDAYTLTATAAGSQAADTDCQTFTIDQTGQRGSAPAMTARCWR